MKALASILVSGILMIQSHGVETGKVQLTERLVERDKQTQCLAAVIWHEARGESLEGQLAVAQVVINRKNSKQFPNTICAVAFQPHQFTDLKKVKYDHNTLVVARELILGHLISPVRSATHYHAYYVDPHWATAGKQIFLQKVGNHLFYKAKWA